MSGLGFRHVNTAVFAPDSSCDKDTSVCRGMEGQLLGRVSLNLNSLGGPDVEVLRCSLLGWWAVWGVGATTLLRGAVVKHDGWVAVTTRVVRSCDMSLCELAD